MNWRTLAKILGGIAVIGAASVGTRYIIMPVSTADSPTPTLHYANIAEVDCQRATGQAGSICNMRLSNDGGPHPFSANLPLKWKPANGVADLGLDTGTFQASKTYYLYAVQNSDQSLRWTIRGSQTNIDGGPTGYNAEWKYLGRVYADQFSRLCAFTTPDGGVDGGEALVPDGGATCDGGLRWINCSLLYEICDVGGNPPIPCCPGAGYCYRGSCKLGGG